MKLIIKNILVCKFLACRELKHKPDRKSTILLAANSAPLTKIASNYVLLIGPMDALRVLVYVLVATIAPSSYVVMD
ncbi:hypothetical protein CsSME_00037068 [Camellia sinensis var. sinensis]